jgi:ABC-type oligopeptide transport system substrate-binding subunit
MYSGFRRKTVIAVGAALLATVVALTACGGNGNGKAQSSTPTSRAAGSSSATTASPTASQGHDDELALQIFDAIVRGDFKSATTNFDSTMQQQLSPDALSSAWTTYQEAFGKYQSHGDPQDVALGDLTVVNVPLQMAREPGEFRVTFHPNATVAGLYFLKTGVPVS